MAGLTAFFTFAIMLALLVFIFEGVRDAFDPERLSMTSILNVKDLSVRFLVRWIDYRCSKQNLFSSY